MRCTGNICRGQMTEVYLKKFSNKNIAIYSVGIETHGLNPGEMTTMAKDGIDILSHTSNNIEEYKNIEWDFIITVYNRANENYPFIAAPNAKRLSHNFYAPSNRIGTPKNTAIEFPKARDEI